MTYTYTLPADAIGESPEDAIRCLRNGEPLHVKLQLSEFEIDELLASQRQIAVIWCAGDVQVVRPNLTREQAWEVLEAVKDRHDGEYGISWDVLSVIADDLFDNSTTNHQEN
jgi:hypothetical protein